MKRLTSWKEIAAYLGVSVRTAQLWERDRNLPIQRLPGARSQVTALKEDLDRWRESASHSIHAGGTEDPAHPENSNAEIATPGGLRLNPLVRWIALVGFATALTVGAVIYARAPRPGPPALFRAERNVLIVTDAHGNEVWRHSFPYELHHKSQDLSHQWFWSGDMDQDGETEILIIAHPQDERARSATLNCFSSDGRLRWTFTPGRQNLRSPKEQFEAPFHLHRVVTAKMHGKTYAVVTGFQHLWYPAQIAVLSPYGELAGEYWHSGRLTEVVPADLDGNGVDELYLGGINNGLKAATLVVLDLDRVRGASREPNHDYQLLGFPPAHERARVLFQRSCINQLMERYNAVAELSISPRTVTVGVWERFGADTVSLYYELDQDLKSRNLILSDGFFAMHKRLENRGELDHRWTDAEHKAMQAITDLGPSDAAQ